MKMKRDKMIKMVIEDVRSGKYPGYSYTFNGEKAWEFSTEPSLYGTEVLYLSRGVVTTVVSDLIETDEIVDTIMNHLEWFYANVDNIKKTNDFLASDEGKEWRK